jgi:hypothetical protein
MRNITFQAPVRALRWAAGRATTTRSAGPAGVGAVFAGLLLVAQPWATTPVEPATPAASASALALPYQPAALRLALPTGKAGSVPADTSAASLTNILADLRRRSYFLNAVAGAGPPRATNLAQRLCATLAPARYTVAAAVPGRVPAQSGQLQPVAPAKKQAAWQVSIGLRGIGRGGHVAYKPAAAPTLALATDTSVRYQHGAAFAVEYTNTPSGVRQNYYLAQRPGGAAGPVQVQLTLATKLRATLQFDGQALALAPAGGGAAVLRYGELRAWDATGRPLPSRLRLRGATALALEVDDADATYPLTIDPLLTTPINRIDDPDNTDYDFFSTSLAGAGDVNGDGYADVVIGTSASANGGSERGSAYLYYGSPTGLGTTAGTVQRLDDPSNTDGDLFGASLGGAATGAGDVNGDGYGDVIIGAYQTANGGTNRGSAYLYLGSATGLTNTPGTTAGTMQRFDDPANTDNDVFGGSVAGAGDVNGDGYGDVIIGAYQTANGGSAYLYLGSATGLGALLGTTAGTYQRLNDPNNASGDFFGFAVAGAGDVNSDGYADVVIGAYRTTSSRGSAYVYLGSATGLGTTAGTAAGTYKRFNDPAATNTDSFGVSVAGAGDVNGDGYADVLIGAYGTANGGSIRGSAYLYLGSATGVSSTAGTTAGTYKRFNDPANRSYDFFGSSVAGAGDVNGDGYADVIIGAYGTGNTYRGNAYLYLGSATGPSTTAGTTAGKYQRLDNPSSGTDEEQFGSSVAGAGDVNGDGYADVLVGAFATNNGGSQRGSAYFYAGSAAPLLTTSSAVQKDPNTTVTSDNFGYSVAGAGDVNGDGYADVIVGASRAATTDNATATGQGRAYVYLGSATGLGSTASTRQTLNDPNTAATSDNFGYSVAAAGDVNGDGYADVIIGAAGAATTDNATSTTQGRAYLYLGSATGLTNTAGTTAGTRQILSNPNTTNAADSFGNSVAGAGDVNGDGYADVLIGAYNAATTDNATATTQGRAYLYLGSATGLGSTAGTTAGTRQTLLNPNTTATNDNFGISVAGAGDVNGDGYADVIIGAYQAATTDNTAATRQGRAYLYLGSATGLNTTAGASQTLNDPNTTATNDLFGFSVAGAGDVNGDGYADVIIGAYQAATTDNATATTQGRAYLYLGSATGLTNTAGTRQTLNDPNTTTTNDFFGYSVAGAGDVNGDGYDDVLIGAYQASTTNNTAANNKGRSYLYLGSAAGLTNTAGGTAGTRQTLNDPNTTTTSDFFGYSVAGAGDVNGDGYADVSIGAYNASTTDNAAANGQGRSYLYLGNQGDARPGGRLRLLNTDLSTPLQAAANKPAAQFGLGLTTRSVQGRVRARLVWEVVAQGQPFSAGSTPANSVQYTGRGPWTDMPVGGTELRQLVRKAGRLSYVRARLEYASASPLLAGTSTPVNGTGGVGSAARYGPWQYVVAQQLATLNAVPLPVVLTQFSAVAQGPAVDLAWATASEVGSARFEVERSLDGASFTKVGEVAAAGRSASGHAYAYRDARVPTGQLYYRLRQVDLDGSAYYSPVRSVVLAGVGMKLSLYPNPAPGAVTLTGAQPGTVVTVLNALGSEVLTATTDASGTAALPLPRGLATGVYVVRVGSKGLRLTVE